MKSVWVVCLSLFMLTTACAQDKPSTTRLNLDKHDLSWITTASDFNQKPLSLEAIDSELSKLVAQAIKQDVLTSDIEIPINTKKLQYLGRKFPNDTGLFGTYNNWYPDKLDHLTWKAHFYTYGDFIITTKQDQAVDQKNVYYAIRSIIILQERYPELYEKLISATKTYITDAPAFVPLVNANQKFWIAFNDNPAYISSNNTIFMYRGTLPNTNPPIAQWNNISVINIHDINILGQSDLGSKPIYNASNPWKNYELHMTEGLPVSIAHEMLHNYIDYAYTADEHILPIKLYRGKTNFIYAEENAVIHTLYSYFKKKGGLLSNQSNYYYKTVFEPNIKILNRGHQLKAYSKVFSNLNSKPKDYKSNFLIPIFE